MKEQQPNKPFIVKVTEDQFVDLITATLLQIDIDKKREKEKLQNKK